MITQGFLLGISSGLFCLVTCLPFIGPMMVLAKRSLGQSIVLFCQFLMGRFFGYLLFGIAAGFIGEKFFTPAADKFLNIAMVGLSLILILYVLGILKEKEEVCLGIFSKDRPVIWIGFLTGANLCPPFAMALGSALSFHSVFSSILFFTAFFVGTSLYFLLVFFLVPFGRIHEMRFGAKVAALAVATLYIIHALGRFFGL